MLTEMGVDATTMIASLCDQSRRIPGLYIPGYQGTYFMHYGEKERKEKKKREGKKVKQKK